MRIFTDTDLKIGLSLKKIPMVYYISEKVALDSLEEIEHKEGSLFPQTQELIDSRPFDEVILIVSHTDANGDEAVTTILHVEENGTYRNFKFNPNTGFENMTVRENFTKKLENGDFNLFGDIKKDQEQLKLNQAFMGLLLLPFTQKSMELHFCVGAARSVIGKKNKLKKKNFMLVTKANKRYVSSNSIKTKAKVLAHSVCGHTMTFHKNPHYMGSDRHGNPTQGSSWRRPHKTGQGKENINKIRLWIN